MTAKVYRQDFDDGVRVARTAFGGGISELVVDSAGTRDFVVNCLRVARPFRAVVLTLHEAARSDFGGLARSVSDVVPELLSAVDSNPVCERLPIREKFAVHQDSIFGLHCGTLIRPARRNKGPVCAWLWVSLAQDD